MMYLLNLISAFIGLLSLVAGLPSALVAIPVSDTTPTNATLDDPYNSILSTRGFPGWFDDVEPQPTYGAPYCRFNHPERGEECILTTRMISSTAKHFEIYLFDHNCVMIGVNTYVPFFLPRWNFFSQLPYSVVVEYTHGGKIGFWYAGRHIEPKNYRQYECYNTGSGDPRALLSACQIHWDCSS